MITEHWRSEEQINTLKIGNFKISSSYCRENIEHGGAAIFTHKSIATKTRKDYNDLSIKTQFECAAVEMHMNDKWMILIVVYRPPNANIEVLISKLYVISNKLVHENKPFIMGGDFNVDFRQNSKTLNRLESLFGSFNMEILVDKYTRITNTSKTCIDNAVSNIKNLQIEVIQLHISDHLGIQMQIQIDNVKRNMITVRRITENNINIFRQELYKIGWTELYDVNDADVNRMWKYFHEKYKLLYDKTFPLENVTSKSELARTKEVPIVKKQKEILDILYVYSRHNANYISYYNLTKKKYVELLNQERKQYYNNRMTTAKNINKTTWELIRNHIQCNKNDIRPEYKSNPSEADANDFNDHFVDLIEQVIKDIPNTKYDSALIPAITKTIFMDPVTENEVRNIVNELNNTRAVGIDGISVKVIKETINEILKPLTYIINKVLEGAVFPDELKIATVTPVYKNGEMEDMTNYRPISILNNFSKIIERVIVIRLNGFLQKHNILNNCQHGFIKNKSINTAIFNFLTPIYRAIDRKCLPVGVFFDLSKAFDTISHNNLMTKLQRYGIRGNAYKLLASYLNNRKQHVRLQSNGKDVISDSILIRHGVPQGSILGPLIFLLYINDLNAIYEPNTETCINYADDINVVITKHLDMEETKLQVLLMEEKTKNWINSNKLKLNETKTKKILFANKLNQSYVIDAVELETQKDDAVRFLGVYIDPSLNYKHHIRVLSGKLNKAIYALRTLKPLLHVDTLKTVYYGLFHSNLRYGIMFWGASRSVNGLFIAQKKAIRLLSNLKYRESCRGHFKKLHVLTVHALYIYECLTYLIYNRTFFGSSMIQHAYETRSVDRYNVPSHKKNHIERGPEYMCIKLYNQLPSSIKNLNSMKFRKALKDFLIELEPYSIEEFLGSASFVLSD